MKIITTQIKNIKVFGLVFMVLFAVGLHLSTVFGAAFCVTNPWGTADNNYDNRCPVAVSVSPSSATVASGGNTNIALNAINLFQYDVQILSFDAWMVEDGTGIVTPLSYTGSMPMYAATRIANTGVLTKSVTVHFCVQNTQGVIGCDSTHINVVSPPVVHINFSFLEKAAGLLGSSI